MATSEQIIEDFKNKCQSIILNHTPNPGVASIGGISRISSVVTGMGAQLNDLNTEITEEANNILRIHSNNPGIDASKLKDDLLEVQKEMIALYIRNSKLE